MYLIYKVTNLINNKIYIGKTNNLERRRKEHEQKTSNSQIDRAIKKYGKENFKWEVIELVEKEKSNEREKYWIEKYNTYFRNKNSNGYNMTKGGDGGNAWNVSRVHIYDLQGNYIKTFQSISDLRKELNTKTNFQNYRVVKHKYIMFATDTNNPPLKITPKKKISRSIPILQLDKNKNIINEFNAIKDVEKMGYSRTGVIGCIKGKYKSSGGYFWCKKDQYNKVQINNDQKEIRAYGNDRILQFSTDGELLNCYCNCREAGRKNGISNYKKIHKALSTETHFSHGYIWYKQSEYNGQYANTEITT